MLLKVWIPESGYRRFLLIGLEYVLGVGIFEQSQKMPVGVKN